MGEAKTATRAVARWAWESDAEYERRSAKATLAQQVGAARRRMLVEQGVMPDRIRASRAVYRQLVPELMFARMLGAHSTFMGLRIIVDDDMAEGFELFRAFHAYGRPLTEIKAARANKRRFRAKPSLRERVDV